MEHREHRLVGLGLSPLDCTLGQLQCDHRHGCAIEDALFKITESAPVNFVDHGLRPFDLNRFGAWKFDHVAHARSPSSWGSSSPAILRSPPATILNAVFRGVRCTLSAWRIWIPVLCGSG